MVFFLLSFSDLSHHRTCGSAYSGSLSYVQFDIVVHQTRIAGGTFVRLATPSPWHQRPTSLPEGCFKVAFGGMRKVKFFYETLSVQSWPEASERHFDVKNLWLWLQVFQPDTVSTGIGRLCGWRCFVKWCSVKWRFVKYWQGAGKKYYLVLCNT